MGGEHEPVRFNLLLVVNTQKITSAAALEGAYYT